MNNFSDSVVLAGNMMLLIAALMAVASAILFHAMVQEKKNSKK